jgi:hypothetical protein
VVGDIQVLLETPLPDTGHANSGVTCLFLAHDDFGGCSAIARPWHRGLHIEGVTP